MPESGVRRGHTWHNYRPCTNGPALHQSARVCLSVCLPRWPTECLGGWLESSFQSRSAFHGERIFDLPLLPSPLPPLPLLRTTSTLQSSDYHIPSPVSVVARASPSPFRLLPAPAPSAVPGPFPESLLLPSSSPARSRDLATLRGAGRGQASRSDMTTILRVARTSAAGARYWRGAQAEGLRLRQQGGIGRPAGT